MKYISSLTTAVILMLSGCVSFENAPHLLTAAHEIVVPENKNLNYNAGSWHKAAFPVTLDRLMLAVRNEAVKRGVGYSFDVPDSGFIADRFNQAAAEAITSGGKYDPTAFRKEFLNSVCGEKAAPFMAEYLSILERRHVFTFASCDTFAPPLPEYIRLTDVYDKAMIDAMAHAVSQAREAAKDTPFADTVNREYDRFNTQRKILEDELQALLPVFHAEKDPLEWHTFYGLNGGPAKIETTVAGHISDDRKALVLRMVAYENKMDKRKITGRTRDYSNAWRDDRFEIFIVPEENPDAGIQFVITSGGVLWDARCRGIGLIDTVWNSNAVYNQIDRKDAWQAELIIPLADFGYDQVPDKPFLINIYRFRNVRGEPETRCAWSPIRRGANYQTERFGKIIWGNNK